MHRPEELHARAARKTAARAPVRGARPAAVSPIRGSRFGGQGFLPVFLCGLFSYQIVGKYREHRASAGGIARTPCKSSEKRVDIDLIPKLDVFAFSHINEGVRPCLRARGILSPDGWRDRLPRPFRPISRSRTTQIKARNFRALTTTANSRFDPVFPVCLSRPKMLGNLPLQTAPPTSHMGRIIRSRPIRFY